MCPTVTASRGERSEWRPDVSRSRQRRGVDVFALPQVMRTRQFPRLCAPPGSSLLMAIKASVVSAGAILRAEVIFWRTNWSLAVSAGNAMTILTQGGNYAGSR